MSAMSTLKINASENNIKSVTVFKSSKAEIVRHFALELKAGQNKIEIRGLPDTIDTHSVRVSGLGEARLYDIVCNVSASKDTYAATDSPTEVIRRLKGQILALESERVLREHEREVLVNYARSLTGEHVAPSQISGFLGDFMDQGRKNLEAIAAINEKILQVGRQIEKETDKTNTKKGCNTGELDIVLGTDVAASIDLEITYIVSNVFWKPTYELHATTDNGKPSSFVALHYRARISQSTGEDWTSTALTLSTMSSDTIAKRIPQLVPVKFRPIIFRPTVYSNGNKGVNLFTNNTHPFGQPHTQINSGFVGSSHPPQPALFGQAPVQSSGSSIFGPQAQAPAQPIFGFSPVSQSQKQFAQAQPSGFGLFGTASVSQSQQQLPQTQPSGSGLFGSTSVPQSQQQTQPSGFGLFGSTSAQQSQQQPTSEEEGFEEITAPQTSNEPATFVNETPVSISFSITGESTIPSDGIEHQVSVAVLSFESKVSYIAIPRIEPRVFLQCQVRNSSEYRLLSGPVRVILDDGYVSNTFIPDVSTGDTFDCTLGGDTATKVSYSRTTRTAKAEGGSFSEAKKTITYTTKITIYNKHSFPIPNLVVRDAVPICDDKRAKVILRKPDGLADAKDGEKVVVNKDEGVKVAWEKLVYGKGGEKEGKFEWTADVKSKDKVVLESEWDLKAPEDTFWESYDSL